MAKKYYEHEGKKVLIRKTKSSVKLNCIGTCLHCGTEFVCNKSTALYCSDNCRTKEYKKKKQSVKKVRKIIKTKQYLEWRAKRAEMKKNLLEKPRKKIRRTKPKSNAIH